MGYEAMLLCLEDEEKPALLEGSSRRYCGEHNWTARILRIGFLLLPSFVQSRFDKSAVRKKKISATSWLDGLRGVASVIVFLSHSMATYHTGYSFGYGYRDNLSLLQLPIVRLLYLGHPMVVLFFTISGFTLSYKPLRLLRNRQWDQLLRVMSSSTFRRGARLYFPTIASTFIILIMLQLGLYEYPRQFVDNPEFFRGASHETHPARLPTFSSQLSDWIMGVLQTSNPFVWADPGNRYDNHLWSIPVEFRGSMVLAVTILGLARIRLRFRLPLIVGLISYTLWVDRWDIFLFYCGLLLAEINMIQGHNTTSPNDASNAEEATHNRGSQLKWIAVFVIGLFLLSQPEWGSEETPGYIYLVRLISKQHFWEYVGAVVVVWAISNSGWLQWLFTNPVVQYLGDISFSVYLVHGSALHVVGYSVMPNVLKFVNREDSFFMYEVGFVSSSFIIIPATIWAADIFWRFVDLPVLSLVRYIEGKCCVLG